MKILYINANGAGFADHIDVADGTTVAALFAERMPHCKPADYLIRVNRQPTSSDYALREGDRVSITPMKIEGAAVCAGVAVLNHDAGACHE
ncbi:MAG: molybdopterin converting factor [Pirellulales bacterium]|nr:molybdopterin converting factor [Pirellulales bacterium]